MRIINSPTLRPQKPLDRRRAIRTLVAEFDARWGKRVTRTREVIEVAA